MHSLQKLEQARFVGWWVLSYFFWLHGICQLATLALDHEKGVQEERRCVGNHHHHPPSWSRMCTVGLHHPSRQVGPPSSWHPVRPGSAGRSGSSGAIRDSWTDSRDSRNRTRSGLEDEMSSDSPAKNKKQN